MEKQEDIMDAVPSHGSLIRTFGDCPYRIEYLKTRDEVLGSGDWERGLCPNTCPLSLRNSDYSKCRHPMVIPHEANACSLGGATVRTGFDRNGKKFAWCEAEVAIKRCKMGFVR